MILLFKLVYNILNNKNIIEFKTEDNQPKTIIRF